MARSTPLVITIDLAFGYNHRSGLASDFPLGQNMVMKMINHDFSFLPDSVLV